MLRLQFTPATAFSIASTSAPMSRPSVAEPSAGEAFLQEALSSLLRQRLYSPGPRTSRMPAARASLGVMLPEGHPDPLIIILRVTLGFAKQRLSTPAGPWRSGWYAQFRGPPPVLPIWRGPAGEKILFLTVKLAIFSPGFMIENTARGTKAVTCSIWTSCSGGVTETIIANK